MNKQIETAARSAFWGGLGSDILTAEYPNGCTLRDAINYYTEHADELTALGFIKQ